MKKFKNNSRIKSPTRGILITALLATQFGFAQENQNAEFKGVVGKTLADSKSGSESKAREQNLIKDKAEAKYEAEIKLERERERRAKIAELSAREVVVRKSIADSKKKAAQAEDRYKTIDKVIKALSPKEKSQEKKLNLRCLRFSTVQ